MNETTTHQAPASNREKSEAPHQDPIRSFLARARLHTYIAERVQKLHVGTYRVLGYSEPAGHLVYVDTYFASDDDSVLRGVEVVLDPGVDVLLRIAYHGGFRAPRDFPLTSRPILDRVLKPCRRVALTEGLHQQDGLLDDRPYRYRLIRSGNTEEETIEVNHNGDWLVVHDILFTEVQHQAAPPSTQFDHI